MTAFHDLSLLRAFVSIVESGSISAGARRLKIPQPTLSRYLRQLEENSSAALLRRDTHRMCLTETGHRLLEDARAILALAEEAEQRLHQEQAALRGHLRLFATIDSGQFTTTRLISSFLKRNPGVTAELAYNNRPLHMIQEGCDAGVVVGEITDESVVARPAGKIARYVAASPEFLKGRPKVKDPSDLRSWPWVALSGAQFGGSKAVTLYCAKKNRSSDPYFTLADLGGCHKPARSRAERTGNRRAPRLADSRGRCIGKACPRIAAVERQRIASSCCLPWASNASYSGASVC